MSALRNILGKIKRMVLKETEEDTLRRKGVSVGKNTKLYNVEVDGCFPHLISIGTDCCITHTVILAHDGSTQNIVGYSKLGRVQIGNNVFVGYKSVILPGVAIGDNVIIGAGSVVTRDIPANSIACGVPAKVIGKYDEYVKKINQQFESSQNMISNTLFSKKSAVDKKEQAKLLADGSYGWDL